MLRSLTLALFMLLPALSEARTLFCQANFNNDVLFEKKVDVKAGESNKKFGTLGGLEFFISDKGENKIELQVFNTYEPSRSYATSVFKESGSTVELAVWKQDSLLEARCSN